MGTPIPAGTSVTKPGAVGTPSPTATPGLSSGSRKLEDERKPAATRLHIDPANASGRILYRPAPDYPAGVPAAKAPASVSLRVVVGEDGEVKEAVITAGDPALGARAVATIQQWRYAPYVVDGRAVEFETTAQMEFKPGISTPRALATAAYQAGYNAFLKGDYEDALKAFRHVLQYDPKFAEGWNEIGRIHLVRGEYKEATAAFERQLKESPTDLYARNNIGLVHWLQKQYPEALASYNEQLRKHANDGTALTSVGLIHEEQKEYGSAAPELEKALAVSPSNAMRVALANCYCHLNQKEKCASLIETAAAQPETAQNWQSIAAGMAERGLLLEEAQKYAKRAVSTFEMLLGETKVERVNAKNLQDARALAEAWETLGQVHMERGDLETAERYLKAAWLLHPDDLYPGLLEKRGNREEAIRYYRMSVVMEGGLQTREHLAALAGGEATNSEKLAEARREFEKQSSRQAGTASKDPVQAEFYLLHTTEGQSQLHFIAGDESLREFGSALKQVEDPVQFEGSPVKTMLRRVEVTCMTAGEPCNVRFLTPKESLERIPQ